MFRIATQLLCLFALLAAARAEPWVFESVEDKRIAPFEDEATRALVVVFISTDCPVANYFQPDLRRLQEKYRDRGVRFVMVHPDDGVTREAAQVHAKDFEIRAPVVLDPELKVARRLEAEFTPEAFLVGRDGRVRYRGRVNDIYVSWGSKRRAPRRRDLDLAIEAFLGGEDISQPITRPVGCYIVYPEPKSAE